MTDSHEDKPLPKPPRTPFGRKKTYDEAEEQPALLADRLAAAMAEGKVEEFLKQEMPDNEYARSLTSMMMGMTGMMPFGGEGTAPRPPETGERPLPAEAADAGQEVPDDVRAAIQGGDVQGLMDLLRREHRKRMPDADAASAEEQPAQPGAGQPVIDRDLIDALIRIANDNSVTMDWIILRAIKVYVKEYEKTGRL